MEMALYPCTVERALIENPDRTSSACDRFFSIHELVLAFLHETDTPDLVNCQGVCRLWNGIIDRSIPLQESLFLKPVSSNKEENDAADVRLNPVLGTHFPSLFGIDERIPLPENACGLRTSKCGYDDLQKLTWARASTRSHTDAPSAFARREASWRKMLVSQPPLKNLQWWHEWESSDHQEKLGYTQYPILAGGGYQQVLSDITTIGALWDMLEARLLRGCTVHVTFFLSGGSAEDDPTASEAEKRWERESRLTEANTMGFPRIRLCSHQVWPGQGPAMYQRFNVQSRAWEIHDQLTFEPQTDRERLQLESRDGNGVTWLNRDCAHDDGEENWRWSRSDAFENATVRQVNSRVTGSESRRSERLRTRHRERLARQ